MDSVAATAKVASPVPPPSPLPPAPRPTSPPPVAQPEAPRQPSAPEVTQLQSGNTFLEDVNRKLGESKKREEVFLAKSDVLKAFLTTPNVELFKGATISNLDLSITGDQLRIAGGIHKGGVKGGTIVINANDPLVVQMQGGRAVLVHEPDAQIQTNIGFGKGKAKDLLHQTLMSIDSTLKGAIQGDPKDPQTQHIPSEWKVGRFDITPDGQLQVTMVKG